MKQILITAKEGIDFRDNGKRIAYRVNTLVNETVLIRRLLKSGIISIVKKGVK